VLLPLHLKGPPVLHQLSCAATICVSCCCTLQVVCRCPDTAALDLVRLQGQATSRT
jgi:hypothetical protein